MNQNHWANQPERGNRLALWLTTQIVRYLPPWLLPIAVSIISRYYYHTSPRARRNITRYQQRLQRTTPGRLPPNPQLCRSHCRPFCRLATPPHLPRPHRARSGQPLSAH